MHCPCACKPPARYFNTKYTSQNAKKYRTTPAQSAKIGISCHFNIIIYLLDLMCCFGMIELKKSTIFYFFYSIYT